MQIESQEKREVGREKRRGNRSFRDNQSLGWGMRREANRLSSD
jgi:hypothetical protein